jgi:hypothetical protein
LAGITSSIHNIDHQDEFIYEIIKQLHKETLKAAFVSVPAKPKQTKSVVITL